MRDWPRPPGPGVKPSPSAKRQHCLGTFWRLRHRIRRSHLGLLRRLTVLTSTTPLRVALLHVTPPTFVGGYETFARKLAVQLGSFGIDADQVTVPSGLSRVAYLVT